MSRAALLPTPGDPFLLSYWLRNFRTWAHHVDRLYVCISWPQAPEIEARLRADIEAVGGIVILGSNPAGETDHGQAMEALLRTAAEDVILFIEDDFYIREPDIVDATFREIESGEYDISAIERGSMGQEIISATRKLYPIPGPGLWPTMLVSSASRFRAITETFSARNYEPGDVVTGIGHVIKEGTSADTFGAAAMEMRSDARLHSLLDCSPYQNTGPYVHIGSLSSGPYPWRTGSFEGQNVASWALRTSWWRRFHRTWPGGLAAEHSCYGSYVDLLCEHFGTANVNRWMEKCDRLVTWDEA